MGGWGGLKKLTIFYYGIDLGHICGAEELTIFHYGNDLGHIFGGYTPFIRPASYVQETYTHQHLVLPKTGGHTKY